MRKGRLVDFNPSYYAAKAAFGDRYTRSPCVDNTMCRNLCGIILIMENRPEILRLVNLMLGARKNSYKYISSKEDAKRIYNESLKDHYEGPETDYPVYS